MHFLCIGLNPSLTLIDRRCFTSLVRNNGRNGANIIMMIVWIAADIGGGAYFREGRGGGGDISWPNNKSPASRKRYERAKSKGSHGVH